MPPKRFSSAWWIELVFRLLLGGYFIYYGLLKIPDPTFFAIEIRNYRILPDPFNSLLALTLPWLELLAGFGVITRRLYAGSLVAINGMLFVFILALSSALLRGLDISCGCAGDGGETGGLLFRLIVDVVALAAGMILLAWHSRESQT